MARKKPARRRRAPTQTIKILPKRRLPWPPPKKEPLLPARPPSSTEAENPYVVQIVEHIQRVSAISSLPVFSLLEDFTGMLEAALQLYADNARSYAATGHFIDDPPEVKETYRRARERYLKATEQYPATYREMQIAFAETFALLLAPGRPSPTGTSWPVKSSSRPIWLTARPGPAIISGPSRGSGSSSGSAGSCPTASRWSSARP